MGMNIATVASSSSVARDKSVSRILVLAVAFAAVLVAIYVVRLKNFYSFNSDQSIQIIMARYFTGAAVDFYYWGQNRMGSFVPILLILPVKVLGLHPLASAVAVSTILYLGFIYLLTRYSQSLLAVALVPLAFVLLPAEMYDLLLYTGHPYASLMFLCVLGFSILFPPNEKTFSEFPLWRFFAAGLTFSVAFWVSETAAAAVAGIALIVFWRRHELALSWLRIVAFGLGLAVFVPLILYWRHKIGYEGHDAEYLQIATLSEILRGLEKFFRQFTDLINKEGEKTWTAYCAGIVMIAVTIGALFAPLGKNNAGSLVKWLAAFNVFYFLVVLLAHHSYYGGGQIQRFWTAPVMISMALCVLLPFELWRSRCPALMTLSAVACLACLASLAHLFVLRLPGTLPLVHVANYERMQKLGARYVQGDFWDVFPLNIVSRFQMIAAPAGFGNSRQLRPRFERASEIFIILNQHVDMRPESWKPFTLSPTTDSGVVVAKRN
jgi:hypothetical protein